MLFLYLFAFLLQREEKKKQDKLGYWPPDIRGSHSWPRGGGPLWSMCGGGPLGPGGGILGGCRHNRTHFHQLQSRWNISLGLQRCETQDHYTDCCAIRSCRININVHARSSPRARKYIHNHTEYPHSLSNQFFHPLTGFLKNTHTSTTCIFNLISKQKVFCMCIWLTCMHTGDYTCPWTCACNLPPDPCAGHQVVAGQVVGAYQVLFQEGVLSLRVTNLVVLKNKAANAGEKQQPLVC